VQAYGASKVMHVRVLRSVAAVVGAAALTIGFPVAGAQRAHFAHAIAIAIVVHDRNAGIVTARRIVADAGGTLERAQTAGTFVAEVPGKRYDGVLHAFTRMGRVVRRDDESADMRAMLAADERTIRDITSENAKLQMRTPRPMVHEEKALYHAMLSRDLTLRAIHTGRITLTLMTNVDGAR